MKTRMTISELRPIVECFNPDISFACIREELQKKDRLVGIRDDMMFDEELCAGMGIVDYSKSISAINRYCDLAIRQEA